MGKIWFYMISIGIVGSIITNNLGELNKVILNEASRGVEFAISLAGSNNGSLDGNNEYS